MKISKPNRFGGSKRNEDALATIVFISLLAIMLLLATAGGMALIHLHDEVKFLEQQQIKRLNGSQTNTVAIAHFTVTRLDAK